MREAEMQGAEMPGAETPGTEMGAAAAFALQEHPLDTAALAAALTAALSSSHAGAFVSFEGRVRDNNDGRTVVGLEYDAYPALCLAEGEAVVREALQTHGIIAARCVHRVGRLSVGEAAVWVGVIGGHRDEAFRACRLIIDEVKRRVPIWKKEVYADGSSGWIGLGATLAEPAPRPRPLS
jgi:molybdopterin synthase catalytic subunit